MREYIGGLQESITNLRAMRNRSARNALTHKEHYHHWEIPAKLWLKVTGSAGQKRRQHLGRILLACTPPTLYPGMTAQALEQSSSAFVSYFSALGRTKPQNRRSFIHFLQGQFAFVRLAPMGTAAVRRNLERTSVSN